MDLEDYVKLELKLILAKVPNKGAVNMGVMQQQAIIKAVPKYIKEEVGRIIEAKIKGVSNGESSNREQASKKANTSGSVRKRSVGESTL